MDQKKLELDKYGFKAIIFDMDGTLLESTEADYFAWKKVFERYEKTLTYQDYVPILGIRSKDVITRFLGFTNDEDVRRILVEKFNCFVEVANEKPVQSVPYSGEFLKAVFVSPLKVGLATSSRKEKMNLLLTQLGFIEYFDAIVTGEEVDNSKPAPDIFLKAALRLGIDPAECIVVEDGPVGVSAAKKAGMKCVAITATTPAEKLVQADLIISTYQNLDLLEICKKLK